MSENHRRARLLLPPKPDGVSNLVDRHVWLRLWTFDDAGGTIPAPGPRPRIKLRLRVPIRNRVKLEAG